MITEHYYQLITLLYRQPWVAFKTIQPIGVEGLLIDHHILICPLFNQLIYFMLQQTVMVLTISEAFCLYMKTELVT